MTSNKTLKVTTVNNIYLWYECGEVLEEILESLIHGLPCIYGNAIVRINPDTIQEWHLSYYDEGLFERLRRLLA